MFRKLLIASEVSKGEFEIIKYVKGFKKIGTNECLLLQCLNPYEAKSTISTFVTDILEQNLNQQKEMLVIQGFSVETRIVTGDMKHEINRIAEEEGYSIIVAGAAEHTLMGELFFGGAAHELIHHATKPLLLIRVSDSADEVVEKTEEGNIFSHILFPTDFSDNASIAFEYVKNMVGNGVQRVTIAHVQDKTKIDPHMLNRLEEFNVKDTRRLEKLKENLKSIGNVEVDIKLVYGSPTEELLKIIDEMKVSLVVMGSQGRGLISEIYLGSVSHNIARHSLASVLLIPVKHE